MSDLFIRNEGKIFLLIPGSRAGHAWVDNNVAVNGAVSYTHLTLPTILRV